MRIKIKRYYTEKKSKNLRFFKEFMHKIIGA